MERLCAPSAAGKHHCFSNTSHPVLAFPKRAYGLQGNLNYLRRQADVSRVPLPTRRLFAENRACYPPRDIPGDLTPGPRPRASTER